MQQTVDKYNTLNRLLYYSIEPKMRITWNVSNSTTNGKLYLKSYQYKAIYMF